MSGALPPHSVESERAVLTSCMYVRDQGVIDDVAAIVTPEAFYVPAHRHAFEAILALHQQQQPTDPVSVFERLKQVGRADEVGRAQALIDIGQMTPAIAHPQEHAHIIRNYHRQRTAVNLALRVVAEAGAPLEDVDKYLTDIALQLSNLAVDHRANKMQTMREVMGQVHEFVADAYRTKKEVTGVPSGFDSFDKLTTGRHGGDLSIYAGRPGMGKTAFVLCMALNEAKQGYATPVFSLEMSALQLGMRFLSMESRVSIQRLRTGQFQPDKWEQITQSLADLARLPIFIDDSTAISPLEIKRRVLLLRGEVEHGKHPQVTKGMGAPKVDYLQLLSSPEQRRNREEEVAVISRTLKLAAKELNVPMDVVSQLNRAPEGRKDARPTMGELRNSGAIEQDADNIMLLYRDEYYDKETTDKGVAELIIAKQRNGPTTTVRLRFTGEYARFDNLQSDDDYYDNLHDEFDDAFPGGL